MYYLPRSLASLIIWLKNFIAEIAGAAVKLNEPAADVAAAQADAQELLDAITAADLAAENLRKANAIKMAALKKCGKRIRAFITRIKANPLYTEEIGGLLSIVSLIRTGSKTDLKPVLTARITGGLIQLVFTKKGADGIKIFSKLPGEADFTPLDTAINSPYTDPRPPAVPGVAELRQYRAMYVHKGMVVGQWSEVISVSYSG